MASPGGQRAGKVSRVQAGDFGSEASLVRQLTALEMPCVARNF